MRLVLNIIINAVALWLTTLIVSGGTDVTAYEDTTLALVLTYLLLGAIWGVVNGVIGGIIRVGGFCLYVVTLGLIALVVNGFLFWLVSWISSLIGFGLQVDNFWWAMLAALVMSILTAILGALTRGIGRRRDERDVNRSIEREP